MCKCPPKYKTWEPGKLLCTAPRIVDIPVASDQSSQQYDYYGFVEDGNDYVEYEQIHKTILDCC